MKYSIKNLRTFRTSPAYELTLLRDGVPVADVVDKGNGGPVDFYWKDGKEPRVDVTARMYNGQDHTYKGSPEEAKLWAHVRTLPPSDLGEGLGMVQCDPDMFVGRLIDDFEMERQVKRWLKHPCAIIDGGVQSWAKLVPTDAVLAQIRAKFPTAVILNDKPLEEAIALVRALPSK